MYFGFVALGETVAIPFLTRDGDLPLNAGALPTWRAYGAAGLMLNGTGTAAFKDAGVITGATNATPIVVSCVSHGLSTGTRVTITGVVGNLAANGTWTVTRLDADTFSLNTSVGNGAYTSGGLWNVSGLYVASLDCSGANGFEAGKTYSLLWQATVAGVVRAELLTFTVV